MRSRNERHINVAFAHKPRWNDKSNYEEHKNSLGKSKTEPKIPQTYVKSPLVLQGYTHALHAHEHTHTHTHTLTHTPHNNTQ